MSTELTAFYDSYYEDMDTEWRRLGAIDKAHNFIEIWRRCGEASARARVLEIGCGDGAVLAELLRWGIRAEGVEISSSGAEISRSRGFEVTLADGADTGFDAKTFDVVLLSHVVEHLEHPRLVLAEAARIGRWVVVEVPLEYRWRTPRNYRPSSIGHINLYDATLIRQLLQTTGLRVMGEFVSNLSRQAQTYADGPLKGTIKWAIREVAVRLVPSVAQRLFTYNDVILARSDDAPVLPT